MTQYFICVLLLALALGVPGSAQQQPDSHDGQPEYCVNHPLDKDHPATEPHVCACHKPCEEGEGEDPMCRVFCRKDHCHCLAMCGS